MFCVKHKAYALVMLFFAIIRTYELNIFEIIEVRKLVFRQQTTKMISIPDVETNDFVGLVVNICSV